MCVKQIEKGRIPISKISAYRNVPRRTLYRWYKKYKLYGKKGLENKNPGRKPERINVTFEALVLSM